MRPFESFLAPQLGEYLDYRQALGYSAGPARDFLLIFDRYLNETQADWSCFKPAFFLEMSARLRIESRTVNRIVSTLRVFFRFLVRRGYIPENPLIDIPLSGKTPPSLLCSPPSRSIGSLGLFAKG